MRLELHCHSVHSDGSERPEAVAQAARAFGVELFCLTDHDTSVGHEAAAKALVGATVLKGMELSCRSDRRTVHLLLYGLPVDAGKSSLDEELAAQQRRRRERIFEICARFTRWNIRIDAEEILAGIEGTPGRPHVAVALVKAGVCTSVTEAFDRFLRDGGPADVPAPHVDLLHGVELARSMGARVSLAHPQTYGSPAFVQMLFDKAQAAGLEGIEALSGTTPRRVREEWLAFATARGLVVTAGSDYHGPSILPQIPHPGVELPEPHASRLREWLGV